MAQLAISLLGTFQVTLDGHPQSAFETDKTRALLAFLAVEANRPHRREALAALLWPNYSERAARNSLRQTLFRLRQAIVDQKNPVPYLLVSVNDVQFNPAAERWLDVDEFDRLFNNCLVHHPKQNTLCESCRICLEATVGLYQGNFLAGFSLTDCPDFETWQLLQQESYHRQTLDALGWLGNHFERTGEYEQEAIWAKREIELAPWHEAAHRRLMRALVFSGRRQAALRQFYACREILDLELGVKPVAETTNLFKAIRDGSVGQLAKEKNGQDEVAIIPSSVGTKYRPKHKAFSSFINFSAELAKLKNQLDVVLSGRGRVIFVVGEGGSGKSTLIGKFVCEAIRTHENLLAAAGQCDALFGIGIPYQPFCEILRIFSGEGIKGIRLPGLCSGDISSERYRQRVSAVLPAFIEALVEKGPNLVGTMLSGVSLDHRVRECGTLNTRLQKSLDELISQQATSSKESRTGQKPFFNSMSTTMNESVLLDQLTCIFQSISEQFPMILVLDDLQWADVATVSLLLHLGRQLDGYRLLVIGAYRPEAIIPIQEGENRILEPVVHELQCQFGDILIDLDQVDSRDFVKSLIAGEPNKLNSSFQNSLYKHTAGNPLFTVELLRALRDTGDLVTDSTGCWTASGSIDWTLLTPRTEAILAERFSQLPIACREILSAASVQGRKFVAEIVAQVLGYDAGVVIHHLSGSVGQGHNLVKARSVEYVNGQRLSHYRFLHTTFQQYLYWELDAVKRHLYHEATGVVLERFYAGSAEDLAIELAGHFQAAGIKDKAADYLLKPGKTIHVQ